MALSNLPYKWTIKTVALAPGTDDTWNIGVDIKNGNNVVLASTSVQVGTLQTYSEIERIIREQVFMKMETDAGGRQAMLTALVNVNVAV